MAVIMWGADRGSSKLASSLPIFLRAVAHRALFWTGRMAGAETLISELPRGIKKGDAVASPSKIVEVEERIVCKRSRVSPQIQHFGRTQDRQYGWTWRSL